MGERSKKLAMAGARLDEIVRYTQAAHDLIVRRATSADPELQDAACDVVTRLWCELKGLDRPATREAELLQLARAAASPEMRAASRRAALVRLWMDAFDAKVTATEEATAKLLREQEVASEMIGEAYGAVKGRSPERFERMILLHIVETVRATCPKELDEAAAATATDKVLADLAEIEPELAERLHPHRDQIPPILQRWLREDPGARKWPRLVKLWKDIGYDTTPVDWRADWRDWRKWAASVRRTTDKSDIGTDDSK